MRDPTRTPNSKTPAEAPAGDTSEGTLPRATALVSPQEILGLLRALEPVNQSERSLGQLLDRLLASALHHTRPLRVGIFEGAFDPPHRGHEETARAAIGIGSLDLLVVSCYPSPHQWKPHLSPHDARLDMTASYFREDLWTVVSRHERNALEALLCNHLTTGVIGSDVFNRFLISGIPTNFNTDTILVSERRDVPLESAPEALNGRPVLYIGASQLAFNTSSSTEIRGSVSAVPDGSSDAMINQDTARIAKARNLYSPIPASPHVKAAHADLQRSSEHRPERYRLCSIIPRRGLMNGLLSESFLDEVRAETGETVAFRKGLPPHRSPLENLSDELLGLKEFNKLGLTNARAPEALLVQEPLSLWIERAPGETLASLLIGYERGERSLQDACAGLAGVGATLRELHERHPLPFSFAASSMIGAHIEEVRALTTAAPEWQVNEPECQRALHEFHEAGESLLKVGLRCGLVHGDANCGNFLWDADTHTVWAIDLQRFGTQLRSREPAFPSYEYHQLISSLHYFPNLGFQGVRGNSELLLSALREAYGDLPPAEDTFFRARWNLQRRLGRHLRVIPPRGSYRR